MHAPRAYDFDKDAALIYSAFRTTYNIDLGATVDFSALVEFRALLFFTAGHNAHGQDHITARWISQRSRTVQ